MVILSMGANVKPLTKTNQDAVIFARAMREMFSVPDQYVRVVENVDKAGFKAGMDWLGRQTRRNDIAVIFFSGHGAQVPDHSGSSADGLDEAFVPYDFETNPKPTGRDLVWSQEFARWVNALPTDSVITVVDACHSAGLYRSIGTTVMGAKTKVFIPPADFDMTPPPDAAAPTTRAMAGRNRVSAKGILFAAAQRDQSALEGQDGAVFAMAFIRQMINTNQGTMTEVFQQTAKLVHEGTQGKQSPQAVGTPAPSNRVRFGN
ncbi:MAG: caspase domain-containing protein [Alphaproteobacteria bacterium]